MTKNTLKITKIFTDLHQVIFVLTWCFVLNCDNVTFFLYINYMKKKYIYIKELKKICVTLSHMIKIEEVSIFGLL